MQLMFTFLLQDTAVLHEQWVEEYGPTMRYQGFFNVSLSI